MTSFYDGQRVTFIGDDHSGALLGDQGQVVAAGDESSHVMWATGALQGQIALVDHYDLAHAGRESSLDVAGDLDPRLGSNLGQDDDGLDDSLDVGSLAVVGVREVYDSNGEAGVLNLMAEGGHLANFESYAQEALDLIASRVRSDPSFKAAIASLEDEEGESLVRLASHVLLRDAFGGDPE